ncbi:MAG: AMP-binding protein [Clostridia bacterium]|nr:AMP-binding protein [Clostridia bacterium]
MTQLNAPWLENLGDVPASLTYSDGTIFDAIEESAKAYPDYIAFDFMGSATKYSDFIKRIKEAATSLHKIGVRKGDKVTVCMPNSPQGVIIFYAINYIGGIANMIHPLSAEKEIEFYIEESKSKFCLTIDIAFSKFENILKSGALKKLIVTSVKDALSPFMKIAYTLTQKKVNIDLPENGCVIMWNDFLKLAKDETQVSKAVMDCNDTAVILYSGGTTGKTKGIMLTSYNFNALAKQVIATNKMFAPGDKMLAIMPIFHGFGLGVGIHSMLASGGRCVLIPRFTPDSCADLIKKHRPNFIAGVPTLYEAFLRSPKFDNIDLSCFKGVFSGGDSLSVELKKKIDKFLKDHNGKVIIREGYGTTECVTACCLTPTHMSRDGSIGFPFPDTFFKIVAVNTTDEVPYGQEGEICICGPTVMKGYMDQEEETNNTLKLHSDGKQWLHTGDLGMMDEDGFIYFKQRIKRMIVTSGYNVYPSQLENILDAHELIQMSCVIGVADPYKMQKVKAFIMLKDKTLATDETKALILEYCKKNMAKYAIPYDIEFRDTLPKTLVGKVAYRVLEQEELGKTEE